MKKLLLAVWKDIKGVPIAERRELSPDEQRAAALAFDAYHAGDARNPFPKGTARHDVWQAEWDKYEWGNKAAW